MGHTMEPVISPATFLENPQAEVTHLFCCQTAPKQSLNPHLFYTIEDPSKVGDYLRSFQGNRCILLSGGLRDRKII